MVARLQRVARCLHTLDLTLLQLPLKDAQLLHLLLGDREQQSPMKSEAARRQVGIAVKVRSDEHRWYRARQRMLKLYNCPLVSTKRVELVLVLIPATRWRRALGASFGSKRHAALCRCVDAHSLFKSMFDCSGILASSKFAACQGDASEVRRRRWSLRSPSPLRLDHTCRASSSSRSANEAILASSCAIGLSSCARS